ncbi:hypothetical protein [Vibrio vulnificus]|uniref:hypothetical protein n=1 Tax=Vibrio vulnificus TaxID=672 RepID=UPI0019D43A8D|nr:hypothetical protein [Vibrio vulnificus]MBN8085899.1 hypothetical protein [Vibrio vulnificus]MBN8128927.1 hypothetical protein [Vibrio vulnificus]HAS6258245.1 hypothetical protein [Vibrio vulnificus]HDY8076656.1 hypothetical protein [Vibrio vulnificus]
MSWIKQFIGVGPLVVIVVLIGLLFISDSQTQKAREALSTALTDAATKQAKLDVAVSFNQSQTEAIKSLNRQLIEAQIADDWMRRFNVSMDTKLNNTILELGKIFDEEAANYSSGCDERFSSGISKRLQQHYDSRKGSGVSD